MSWPLGDALDRIVELEIEALAALATPVVCDAVPYFFHTQESFPYWTNRIGPIQNGDEGEDLDNPVVTIYQRLVLGHVTAGYAGENEDKLLTWIPQVFSYYSDHNRLETDTQSDGLDYLLEARIRSCTGFAAFANSGLPHIQAGTEFTLTLEFIETVR